MHLMDTTVHVFGIFGGEVRLFAAVGYSTKCPDLVVTPTYFNDPDDNLHRTDSDHWSITHAPSGYALMLGAASAPDPLIDVCDALAGLTDWSNAEGVTDDENVNYLLRSVAMTILQEHGINSYWAWTPEDDYTVAGRVP